MRMTLLPALLAMAFAPLPAAAAEDGRSWQAGDHHVHSEWSVDWDRTTTPPKPIRGGDSPYTRTHNALQAAANGLTWMVHTDHGGPGHSAVTRELAWPELQKARQAVPALIQFHGMEFDVPAAEHASLIIAPGPDEREQQYLIERDYSRGEPLQGNRNEEAQMLEALGYLRALAPLPLLIVNHPSRTATGIGDWGDVSPRELRAWHDAAPQVVVGMEGAPGHQAASPHRGLYRNSPAPTLGGFDQMTAQVGGIWDQMLAEGRHFWITANSDSHINQRDGGGDFDPGQYSKTYVWARHEAGDILDGLRHGRMFTVTGDLIDALQLRVADTANAGHAATMGETLSVAGNAPIRIDLRLHQPLAANHNGQHPRLQHVDVIVGEAGDEDSPHMQLRRFEAAELQQEGDELLLSWELPAPANGGFVRVRGSSTEEATPQPDQQGDDPWQDLWFYSNPVFIQPVGDSP